MFDEIVESRVENYTYSVSSLHTAPSTHNRVRVKLPHVIEQYSYKL